MEVCTSTNLYYERADGSRVPIEDSIRLCAEAGYRQMDMSFVDLVFGKTPFPGEAWRNYMEGLGALAEQNGVRFVQSHGPIHDFFAEPEGTTWQLVKRSVEASAALGIRRMVMHPCGASGEADAESVHQRNVAYFKRLCAYAAPFAVEIAVENMWGKTAAGAPKYGIAPHELCGLYDAVKADNFGICWDTEHAEVEGVPQREGLQLIGGRLKALHISDLTDADNAHILPYTGKICWPEVLTAIAKTGYDGPLTFEMQHWLLSMPHEAVPAALRLSLAVGEQMARQVEAARFDQ